MGMWGLVLYLRVLHELLGGFGPVRQPVLASGDSNILLLVERGVVVVLQHARALFAPCFLVFHLQVFFAWWKTEEQLGHQL